jgi:hypothetical protein
MTNLAVKEIDALIYYQKNSAYLNQQDVDLEYPEFENFIQFEVDPILNDFNFIEIENRLCRKNCRAIWHKRDAYEHNLNTES